MRLVVVDRKYFGSLNFLICFTNVSICQFEKNMPGTGVYFSRIYVYVHIHIFFNQTAALGRQRGCMLLDPPRSY